jgi:hypothetical protein
MVLRIVPVSFADACAFVTAHHRHHKAPVGHKFSLGVASGETLVGVAIVGRPVSRVIQAAGDTLEVIRTATDGTHNANSMLYASAWKATSAIGYSRLITYTQEGETGASLKAAGFRVIGERPARAGWDAPSRPRAEGTNSGIARTLWEVAG